MRKNIFAKEKPTVLANTADTFHTMDPGLAQLLTYFVLVLGCGLFVIGLIALLIFCQIWSRPLRIRKQIPIEYLNSEDPNQSLSSEDSQH